MARTKAFIVVNNTLLATLPAAIQVVDNGVLIGGYSWVGRIATWNALIVTTTDAQLTTFDTAAGAGCVVLVRMADDARPELDSSIDSATLTKLNNWLTARGFSAESTASNRVIIRRLFRRFLGQFELEDVDIN